MLTTIESESAEVTKNTTTIRTAMGESSQDSGIFSNALNSAHPETLVLKGNVILAHAGIHINQQDTGFPFPRE